MWNRRDWAAVGTSALGVFGLTVALFWSTPLNATGEKPLTGVVAVPTYQAGECRVTARILPGDAVMAGSKEGMMQIRAGALPGMQLVIHNPSQSEAPAVFRVELQRSSMSDMLRRVPAPTPPAWSDDYDLSLKPGETRVIALNLEKVTTKAGDTLSLNIGTKLAPHTPAPLLVMVEPARLDNDVVNVRMQNGGVPVVRTRLVSMSVAPEGAQMSVAAGDAVQAK
jgi:hypothetical protein